MDKNRVLDAIRTLQTELAGADSLDESKRQSLLELTAALKEKLSKTGAAMKDATNAMDDRLLFLKHNPDARGVEGVVDKAGDLKSKAGAVTDRTDAARAEADKFLEVLGPAGK